MAASLQASAAGQFERKIIWNSNLFKKTPQLSLPQTDSIGQIIHMWSSCMWSHRVFEGPSRDEQTFIHPRMQCWSPIGTNFPPKSDLETEPLNMVNVNASISGWKEEGWEEALLLTKSEHFHFFATPSTSQTSHRYNHEWFGKDGMKKRSQSLGFPQLEDVQQPMFHHRTKEGWRDTSKDRQKSDLCCEKNCSPSQTEQWTIKKKSQRHLTGSWFQKWGFSSWLGMR